jgi:hypothetical protein
MKYAGEETGQDRTRQDRTEQGDSPAVNVGETKSKKLEIYL